MTLFEAFLEIVLKYSDLKWNQFRDDLIIKCVKILRKFKEGKTREEVLSDKKAVFEIEDFVDTLHLISQNFSPEEIDRLMEALKSFTKAPAPCKTKIIGIMEMMLGKVSK